MLIPDGYDDDPELNEIYLQKYKRIPKGTDVVLIPEELKQSSFKVFSRLMRLRNKASIPDKMETNATDNTKLLLVDRY